MQIREAGRADLDVWAGLRHALWPESSVETARREAVMILDAPDEVCAGLAGPHGHVEGWCVAHDRRGQGYGQDFIGALGRGVCTVRFAGSRPTRRRTTP